MPGFHHVELWIPDFGSIRAEWSWLLDRVGFTLASEWATGQSWTDGGSYLTLTESPNLTEPTHDRRRAGLNHLAFRLNDTGAVDSAMAEASPHGWRPLYADRYPHAGGSEHYAGWLENADGFKVELVSER